MKMVRVAIIIIALLVCTLALITTISRYEKEPRLSPVAADVSFIPVGPAAPTVVAFANPIGALAGPGGGPYMPVANQIVIARYAVLVEDLNGNQELPTQATMAVNTANPPANILTGIYAPLTAPNPNMIRLPAVGGYIEVSCANALTPAGSNVGIACQTGRETLQKIYLFDIPLEQTAPPGNWRPSFSITDSTGLSSAVATSGNPGYPQVVQYGNLKSVAVGTLALNGIVTPQSFVATSLSGTGLNQLLSAVTLSNVGNVPVTTFTITGTDLFGQNIPTSVLSKSAFRVSSQSGGVPPAQCAGANSVTLSNAAQTIPLLSLPYTQAFSLQTGTDFTTIYSCIPNTPISSITGALDTQYKTAIGQDWDLIAL